MKYKIINLYEWKILIRWKNLKVEKKEVGDSDKSNNSFLLKNYSIFETKIIHWRVLVKLSVFIGLEVFHEYFKGFPIFGHILKNNYLIIFVLLLLHLVGTYISADSLIFFFFTSFFPTFYLKGQLSIEWFLHLWWRFV